MTVPRRADRQGAVGNVWLMGSNADGGARKSGRCGQVVVLPAVGHAGQAGEDFLGRRVDQEAEFIQIWIEAIR